jgi:hypothetical protein
MGRFFSATVFPTAVFLRSSSQSLSLPLFPIFHWIIHDRGVVILPVYHLDNTPSLFVTNNLFQGDQTEISVSNVRLAISLQGPCTFIKCKIL